MALSHPQLNAGVWHSVIGGPRYTPQLIESNRMRSLHLIHAKVVE